MEEEEIPGDFSHFNDSVHFKDKGSRAQTERIVQTLRGNPAFQAVL